jgi:hypothetical protein
MLKVSSAKNPPVITIWFENRAPYRISNKDEAYALAVQLCDAMRVFDEESHDRQSKP